MENLLRYIRKFCKRDELYDYLLKYKDVLYDIGVVNSDMSDDELKYFFAEYRNMCKDFATLTCDISSVPATVMSALSELQFLYDNRFRYQGAFNLLVDIADKYRAEKGINWTYFDDYMRMWAGGSILGFEVTLTHTNPLDKSSPVVFRLEKDCGLKMGYVISVDSGVTYDEIKKYKNWVKTRSQLRLAYIEYQRIMKDCNILEG